MYDTRNPRFIFNSWWDGYSRDDGWLDLLDRDPEYELLSIPSGFRVYEEEPETLFVEPGTYAVTWNCTHWGGDTEFTQYIYANNVEYFAEYDEYTNQWLTSQQQNNNSYSDSTLTVVVKFDAPAKPGLDWDNPYFEFLTENGTDVYHDLTVTRIDR
jgi:hypothetical protein